MNIEAARAFIIRNARPLDLARWQYLFESGSRQAVLNALAAYQNADGGFGHALEPDCWNPCSSPVQTWAATEILREIAPVDPAHPIIQGILRYLETTPDFDGHTYRQTIPSNDDHPHAPWWRFDPAQTTCYNPTASLAGFALRYAPCGSALRRTAARLAQEAFAYLREHAPLDSMHTTACFVSLYEDLVACGEKALVDLRAFEALLQAQLRHVLEADTSVWATEYVCKPSLLIHSPTSAFFASNQALCASECAFIAETQQADGTWPITWDWGDASEPWHISKNWWKADVIIKNVRFVQAMQA